MTVGFLTLAFGRPFYREMASALVRSARKRGLTLPFAVVTDSRDKAFLRQFDVVIPYRKELGRGVEQKLHLDAYAPFDRTIFVDADCLFFAPPDALAASFADKPGFAVCGDGYLTRGAGKYYALKDVDAYLDAWGIERFPRFNSGLIAFDRSPRAAAVFAKAREVFAGRGGCGLKEFKGAAVADEPVFAAAIEMAGQPVWQDEGKTLAVMSDDARELGEVRAAVVHFNIFRQDSFVYARERYRLRFGEGCIAGVCADAFAGVESVCRGTAAAVREFALTTIVFPLWGLYRKVFPRKVPHA